MSDETPSHPPELPEHPPGWVPAGWTWCPYIYDGEVWLQACTKAWNLDLAIVQRQGHASARVEATSRPDGSRATVWLGSDYTPRLTQASVTKAVARFHGRALIVGFSATPAGLPS